MNFIFLLDFVKACEVYSFRSSMFDNVTTYRDITKKPRGNIELSSLKMFNPMSSWKMFIYKTAQNVLWYEVLWYIFLITMFSIQSHWMLKSPMKRTLIDFPKCLVKKSWCSYNFECMNLDAYIIEKVYTKASFFNVKALCGLV